MYDDGSDKKWIPEKDLTENPIISSKNQIFPGILKGKTKGRRDDGKKMERGQ